MKKVRVLLYNQIGHYPVEAMEDGLDPESLVEQLEYLRVQGFNIVGLDEALAYMDETGGEPVDAAIWFLKEREDIWTQFVPSDIADKVKQAAAGM